MLTSLNIENYALIGKLNIDFSKGFNVLTGETGAGKSIIIGALSMVLGERASGGIVRTGEAKAYVEATFDVSKNKKIPKLLKEIGIEADGNLILSREILSAGKTQARINGRAVTQTSLRQVSRGLIDIHGQHEHQSLLDSETHIDLLDNLGGKELIKLRAAVEKDYLELDALKSKFKALSQSKEEREKQIDYLKFQIKEIDEADLKDKEEDELKDEKGMLANAEKLIASANEVYNSIAGEGREGSSLDALKSAAKVLLDMADIDKKLKKLAERLESAQIELDDIASEIEAYQDRIVFDPKRLEEVEDRLYLISELKRKYGGSIKEILKKRDEIEKELKLLEGSGEELEGIKGEIDSLSKKLGKECEELSEARKELAKKIEASIKEELAELNMLKVKFNVQVQVEEDEEGVPVGKKKLKVGPKGIDLIEFLISPNPGEPLKPLAKIASGGEISRVMLGLKSILSKADEIPTMIFDEIDVGIGGQTAVKVGDKLSSLSKLRQVICITHLPQIASKAGRHVYVSKSVEAGKTHVSVRELKEQERIKEVANLLGGKISETTLRTAQELIKSN